MRVSVGKILWKVFLYEFVFSWTWKKIWEKFFENFIILFLKIKGIFLLHLNVISNQKTLKMRTSIFHETRQRNLPKVLLKIFSLTKTEINENPHPNPTPQSQIPLELFGRSFCLRNRSSWVKPLFVKKVFFRFVSNFHFWGSSLTSFVKN